MTKEDYKSWTDEKLICKADQEQEMASLAAQDGDGRGMEIHYQKAQQYENELKSRR
jgi:hypothetical protein